MAEYIAFGETIEGNAVDFTVRALYKKGLVEHPLTKKTMYRYSADRNATGTITKIRPEPTEEDIKKATEHFHRALGDKLKADALDFYTEGFRPIKFIVQEGVTGRHGAQLGSSKSHTIASIKTPLPTHNRTLGHTAKKAIKEK